MRGYLAGYPMVDFRAIVYDGSFHPVDSNELSFKMAGSLAFKDAMAKARPTLLEPVMQVEVQAPSEYAGDLIAPPAEGASLVDGVQRVDDRVAPRHGEARSDQSVTEPAKQFRLGRASQPCLCHPTRYARYSRRIHGIPLCLP